jgi:hypothetical protein
MARINNKPKQLNELICMNDLPDATVWLVIEVLPGYLIHVIDISNMDSRPFVLDASMGYPATDEQLANCGVDAETITELLA